jgi:hypothetical protein
MPRIAHVLSPVPNVFAPVAYILPPVARVFTPIAHVFDPVAHVTPRRLRVQRCGDGEGEDRGPDGEQQFVRHGGLRACLC